MVGLDGIVPYHVEANSEFHTSWNPKSKEVSVERSKVFAKKASLAWLVDCLDMYLRMINQAPSLICKDNLKFQIDSQDNSRSVYRRINLICDYYKIQSIDYALIDLLICWRNRLTHFQAENDIKKESRTVLLSNAASIQTNHCGLDIGATIRSFDSSHFPTFKEVTSFVRASINLVSAIDRCLLNDIDKVEFADKIMIKYINDLKDTRLNNIFSKDSRTAEKTIKQVLLQNGFFENNRNSVDIYCKSIAKLSYAEAKCQFEKGTFISPKNMTHTLE